MLNMFRVLVPDLCSWELFKGHNFLLALKEEAFVIRSESLIPLYAV